MNQIVTTAIVLSRLNYGEADRIITVITPDNGKLRLMAKGVRRVKSKLAGGIELFSVSSLTFIKGKGDIGTLVSSRLQTHFSSIVTDYSRTMLGYDILKALNKTTDDNCEGEYYHLLLLALATLDNREIDAILTKCWFMIGLLKLLGHTPNLNTDVEGNNLIANKKYNFDYQNMSFHQYNNGGFGAGHIKALRLLLQESPERLHIIGGLNQVLPELDDLLSSCTKNFLIA